MNKTRRSTIQKTVSIIREQIDALQNCLLEEEMAFDNLSEGLQQTERGEEMEECIELLTESIDRIEEAIDDLSSI